MYTTNIDGFHQFFVHYTCMLHTIKLEMYIYAKIDIQDGTRGVVATFTDRTA